MNIEPKFKEKVSRKIWDDYFYRVNRVIKGLNKKQRSEIDLELKSHLYESFLEREGENEAERLMEAMENLGRPEEFMKAVVSEKILDGSGKSINPKNLLLGILYSPKSTIKMSMMICTLGLGYLVSFTLGLIAVVRIFFSDQAGVFKEPDGGLLIGITGDKLPYQNDLLGIWTIPLFLITAIILYLAVSIGMKKMIKH